MRTLSAVRDPGVAISTYGHHFKKASTAAGLVDSQGRAKYTPRPLRDFFASTALVNGIPIHEVSRSLGHRPIKVTVTSTDTSCPAPGSAAGKSAGADSVLTYWPVEGSVEALAARR